MAIFLIGSKDETSRVPDLTAELEQILKCLRCSLRTLPKGVRDAFRLADGFTFVTGVGPKGYEKRIQVQQLVTALQEHPQMIQTLELCKVYVVVNGEPLDRGKPLALPRIPPMPGYEKPREISIPSSLKDLVTGDKVSTTNNDSLPLGVLTLKTSVVSMRYKKKGRHNIIYKSKSGYIGYVAVSQLDVQSPYRDHIYGECQLEALDPFKQNERERLANSPVTRAVERFIAQQVQAYAKEFEALDKRRYDQEEKNAISRMNEALDRWKNRFLNELMQGLWGSGEGGPTREQQRLPVAKAAKLELSLSHNSAGLGVPFRPSLKFFDKTGRRIRPTPFRWVSEENNVAMVDEDLMIINTFSFGRTVIHSETLDGKVQSNKVPLEVVRVNRIDISPKEIEIDAGSRQKLEAICTLGSGDQTSDLYLCWTESNSAVARVSSSGLVYGFAPGTSEVIAGDDKCLAKDPCIITVVPSEGRGRGSDKRGRGYPLVLVSGEIDRDPETNEYVNFSREEPPVTQRPQDSDRNIWWINELCSFR